jgi:hypothetical protein
MNIELTGGIEPGTPGDIAPIDILGVSFNVASAKVESVEITPPVIEYFPYKKSDGSPVYDTATGLML